MPVFVDPLESRRLLSSTLLGDIAGTVLQYLTAPTRATIVADETKLVADARSIRGDVQHFGSLLRNDAKSIQGELRALPDNATNRTLVGTLRTDVQHAIGTLGKDAANLVRVGSADARKALADGIVVFFNPNNSTARSRLAADITRLQTETAGPLAITLNDAATFQGRLSTDLTAVANANSTNAALQTRVQAANHDTASALTTAQNDVHTVQADVTTLLHDLA